MKLIKISYPGWEKDFETEQLLKEEFYSHLCKECCSGSIEYFGDDYVYKQDPVFIHSTIDEMLFTACGCEYLVEY